LIKLKGLVKQFAGAPRPAVDHLDLDVAAGEVCVLIGPSGCGKTTTMRMVNRLIEPTSGTIEVNGHDVTHMNPVELRRGTGPQPAAVALDRPVRNRGDDDGAQRSV